MMSELQEDQHELRQKVVYLENELDTQKAISRQFVRKIEELEPYKFKASNLEEEIISKKEIIRNQSIILNQLKEENLDLKKLNNAAHLENALESQRTANIKLCVKLQEQEEQLRKAGMDLKVYQKIDKLEKTIQECKEKISNTTDLEKNLHLQRAARDQLDAKIKEQ